MKKYVLILIMCLTVILTGCELIMQPAPTSVNQEANPEAEMTPVPLATQPPVLTQSPAETDTPAAATPNAEPTPQNTMEFYPCYAHMVSYNPLNGWAEFDYFYLHKGQDAIDYLVEYEGYSVADAEALVNDFADSEFVEQNNNTSLRTIDLDTVLVKMIINNDGTLMNDLQGTYVDTTYLNGLYNLNTDYLLEYFFYYVECDAEGNVIEVRQVYWA